jgi:tape measure domain-containing protein
MASLDKLIIEITGDASGLTKALSQANKNLTTFNTSVSNGNKAVNAFIAQVNKGASAVGRLVTTVNEIKSAFTGLNRSITSSAASITKLGESARTANADIKSFANNLSKVAVAFETISGASKGATAAINSLQRRVAALSTTISATNGSMRTFNRTIQAGAAGAAAGGIHINNYGGQLGGAGQQANRTAGFFNNLNRANVSLMEGFRRHVAQITALRTLTYQALFWFSPLIYSIINVNAQYEKQMQLLKNLSGQSSELAKTQWATETRKQLMTLANTNPFSLAQITESFVRMKVSGLDPLNGSLQVLMDSIAAFGGGNDELQRAGIALQQMVGKTAVSMEELRQQLGEHIPDAMSAMAKGMGLNMAKFYKAVQSGTVESVSAIHNMMVVLNNEHRGAARQMMMTWNGMIARLGTAWQQFVTSIEHHPGRNTFIDQMKKSIDEVMVFLNSPAGVNFAIQVDDALASVAKNIARVIAFIYEWRTQIIFAAKVFALMWGGKLVLGTLTSFITVFAQAIRIIIVSIRALMGIQAAAAVVATNFANAIRGAAVALGICATAEEAAAMSMAAITGAMLGAIGIAVSLAGAIWLVVRALNAKSDAQKNADLRKGAERGEAWDEDKNGYSGDREQEKIRLQNLKKQAEEGGHHVQGPKGEDMFVKDDKATVQRYWQDYNEGAHAYNLKNANTANARKAAINVQWDAAQSDPYAATRARFNAEKAKVKPDDPKQGEKLHTLEDQERQQLAVDAQKEVDRLTDLKKTNKDPAIATAIDQRLNTIEADKESYMQGFVPQLHVAGTKKPKKKKTPRDPMEGVDNSFANAYERSKDLEHQLKDLTDGTETEFDAGAAREEGEKRAKALGKNKDAVRDAIKNEVEYQHQLQKSIKVQQAIIAVEGEASKQKEELANDLDDLQLSYKTIAHQVDLYKGSLERQHRVELQIAEARMNNLPTGNTEREIKMRDIEIQQFIRLKEAINAATRAKEADLVVKVAIEAKGEIEDYQATFRSPIQQADYETSKQLEKYNDALQTAIHLASMEKEVDDDLNAAKGLLNARIKELTQAKATDNEISADSIVIQQNRRIAEDEAAKAAKASIPILEQRISILNEEAAIRHKLNGAGGPLLDWAKKANQDFTDLGATMAQSLTGAMDDFINSLADGKIAFKDFVKVILKQLLLVIIRGLIAKAILAALGMVGTAGNGFDPLGHAGTGTGAFMPNNPLPVDTGMGAIPMPAPDFSAAGLHEGGIAGGIPTFTRNIDPAMFSFARRYHTGGIAGLKYGEVPIIAQKGEGIFTKEQMQAMGKDKNSSNPNNVQVNVINQTGTQADVEHRPAKFDGEKWVETIILKKMGQAGPVRDGLKAIVSKGS